MQWISQAGTAFSSISLRLVSAVLVAGLGASLAAQTVSIRPGRYDTVSELGFADGRSGLRKVKGSDCITSDEARDLVKAFGKELNEAGEACRMTNVKKTGSTLSFDTACRVDGQLHSGRTDVTYGPDSFTVTVTMTLDGKKTSTRTTGKWAGAQCRDDD
jgi:hypothetical protein